MIPNLNRVIAARSLNCNGLHDFLARDIQSGWHRIILSRYPLLFLGILQCGLYEIPKQGMRFHGFGFEFRVKLTTKEPRVIGKFDYFNKIVVRRNPADYQSFTYQLLTMIRIKLIAMAMALMYLFLRIGLLRMG